MISVGNVGPLASTWKVIDYFGPFLYEFRIQVPRLLPPLLAPH